MSNVISFNVYKNTLRRSSGNDPVSSESGYTEILCRFKEGDDWEEVNGGIVTAGFFVSEDNVEQMTANVVNREARFTIPGTLVGNRNPIYFGIAGSISTGENSYITIATNVVKLDVIRGVVIDRLSPDAEADENHYAQLLATLNEGLTSKADKAEIDNRFELHLSVAFDENGVPVKWDNKTTYSAGDFTGSRIVKAFIASNVTQLNGGTFAQTNLTDIYIDKVEGTISISPTAYPAGTTVHYKGEFNAVGFIVRAMKYFEENKADKANVYTKSEVDVALAVKAAADHTHSEYLTAQDISGKYEKPSGGIPKTDLSSEVQASLGKADSALQSHQSLANYYNKTEVDGALAGKAAASHTHSEYLTAQDISGKEDKANKVESNMASIVGTAYPRTKYPSVYAVWEHLSNYFYSRSEIDRFTYTKEEVDTALAGKAAANHTHSEYLTETEASELISGIEELKTDVSYDLYSSSVKAALYNYMSAAAYTDYTYTQGDYSGFYTESNISVSAMTEEGYDLSAAAPVTVPEGAAKCVLYDTVTKRLLTQTFTSGYAIKNLIPNRPYIYIFLNSSDEVLSSGTVKAKGQVRFIDAQCGTSEDAPFNVRDLGGWACDGGQMKYGLIYRGSELNVDVALTNAQKKVFLDELNIGDEIDLRDESSVTDTALDSSRVNYAQIPINYYNSALNMNERGKLGTIIKRIAQNLREGRVTYIHCQAGADRTATVCALLEAVCGVSNSDIDRDYEITSFSKESYSGNRNTRKRNTSHSSAGQSGAATWINYILRINNDNKDTSDANDSFQKRVVRLLIKSGASIDDINDIRAALIDGNPQKLEHPYGKATITANLTNVNISNTADSVYIRQPFEAFLYTDDLYAIKNVSVTMGGSNVTSSCYNHGRISISSVTGDVVITASASNTTIPTKTSDLTNDSGFLTSHQDISGKEDKSNKVTSMSASSTDAQYPTAKAVYDKIRSEIQTAIGGIENGSY